MATATELSFSCDCGQVRGLLADVGSLKGHRFVCMCDDCQSYAHALGRSGDLLDANGGTEVIPVFPANLKLVAGQDNIKCLRLFEKGMFRWYAGCCRSPIANSLSPGVGFIGFFARAISVSDRDKEFGPVVARVLAKYGKPPLPPGSYEGTPITQILMAIGHIVRMFVTGKKRPSPFFKNETNEPIATPHVLSKEERERFLKAAMV